MFKRKICGKQLAMQESQLGDELSSELKKFKATLAAIFHEKNLTNSVVESSESLKSLCDIFDGRLFARSCFILDKHFNVSNEQTNVENFLMNKEFFRKILGSEEKNELFVNNWVLLKFYFTNCQNFLLFTTFTVMFADV
jgi:hypothetical protein